MREVQRVITTITPAHVLTPLQHPSFFRLLQYTPMHTTATITTPITVTTIQLIPVAFSPHLVTWPVLVTKIVLL